MRDGGWLYYIYNFFVFCWEGGGGVVHKAMEGADAHGLVMVGRVSGESAG